jgi:hypothetical protein
MATIGSVYMSVRIVILKESRYIGTIEESKDSGSNPASKCEHVPICIDRF